MILAAIRAQIGFNCPVFDRLKIINLAFTLDHQPQCHRLHPSSGQAVAHFAPQDRAKAVTHQTIQDAAGLLGIDQVHVDLTRFGKSFFNGAFGNLMEDHPAGALWFDLSRFHQMPGNRLAFAVKVSRQVNLFNLCCQSFQFFYDRSLFIRHAVLRLELILNIHR